MTIHQMGHVALAATIALGCATTGSVSPSDTLHSLNEMIAEAENVGGTAESKAFFEGLLSSHFAFRRASGATVSRQEFLEGLKSSGDRRTIPDSVRVVPLGRTQALASCTVTMTIDGVVGRFKNARLFILDRDQRWKLFSWANEQE
jgi:hypothetical protein